MGYKERYTTAYDTDTKGIVMVAMVDQARRAMDNAATTEPVRQLAIDVLRNPDRYLQQVTLMVVSDDVLGPKIDAKASMTDVQIGTAVSKALLVLGWRPAEPTI
jgi:hypothetical protein